MDPCNESGWKCVDCSKGLGFRPDLDRELTEIKVHGILHDLVEAKVIYVSNATMGDIIAANVVGECKRLDMYDQVTIARLILEDPNISDGHGTYWKQQAEEYFKRLSRRGLHVARSGPRWQRRARAAAGRGRDQGNLDFPT